MHTKLLAAIVVMKDGTVRYTVQSASGAMIGGGGTRTSNPPKDPIRTALRGVEKMLKDNLAQKR